MKLNSDADAFTPPFEVIAQGYDFIEAPRVTTQGDLWFSDLTGRGVYRVRPRHASQIMLPDRQWVGGMVFDRSGQVLCSGRGGIVALNPESGSAHDVLTEIEGTSLGAVNDMEGDGKGGFFAGTIDFVAIFETGQPPAPGMFFHMSAHGAVTVLRRDVIASNGIAASPCGKWLYHVETGRGVWRYPMENGLPAAGEIVIVLDDGDGLAVDTAGNLWVACWNTARLLQVSPEGACMQVMTFPYPHIVSIVFGADDPSRLYVATGGNAAQPHTGAVLRLKMEIPGLPGPMTRLKALEGDRA